MSVYEPGKRSANLCKLKSFFDEDFECVDMVAEKNKEPKTLGALVLRLPKYSLTF